MNFGIVEALEKVLQGPAFELNHRLDRLIEGVEELVDLQKTTITLLDDLVELGQKANPRAHQSKSAARNGGAK